MLKTRPHRLTARTQDSHSCNRGSIPREVTTKTAQHPLGFFSAWISRELNPDLRQLQLSFNQWFEDQKHAQKFTLSMFADRTVGIPREVTLI
jgi:hypothetical protein